MAIARTRARRGTSARSRSVCIGGLLPTNRFADEVLSDDPRRVRALWVESTNPANTTTDTHRFEAAVRALDLSVVGALRS